ncbi:LacI family DNA-binding transcriptional regulator [Cohnella sp. AR92]|uniref:LacI family DNA-binding transcriptional regulator n=1 Tax=Cohnella sp. AR92 TaxID=648716 RepID=UPI000F8E7E7E|nr:LacI family DNA-binding transcriptional regulator [Cohnella sp. AR92]RUS47968.1 LacI family transcriptional regulator [Cohnella sp. AR92]
MTKPTIRDVARLANVSISTVSRVMNAPDTVIPSKQERVLDAINELKYKPNALARGLIYKKTNTIGVVIPDIRNSYYADIIRGMEDASKRFGYNLIICNTDHDRQRLYSYLNNFEERQVDGILLTSEPISSDYHKELKRLRMPVVLVSTHSIEYELPSVRINDEQAAYDAVAYLIQSGHRSIGWIGFDLSDSIAGLTRYQGYIRAHRQAGLPILQENIRLLRLWSDDSLDAAHALFLQNPSLTAVFTASDELAIGLLCYLNERGIQVPEQVSVIGFDNIRMSRFTIPKLTTIAQPMYEIGYRSVEKLHARIEGLEDPVLREYLPHELIVRSSTRSIE